jgi:uncharacterized protein YutE (UPF0331/DUF86 family)/predicted nucleotidyltransferase
LIVWLAYRSGERLRVKRQLEALENYFKKFLEHRAKRESIYAVERLAQLSIQALLDLGAMMAVRSRGRKPETYKEVASFICDSLGLAEERGFLEGLAGFRNVLVHGYAAVDERLEEEAFREMERRLPKVIEAVKKYVERVGADPEADERLREVFKRYNVKFAFLFGSRARGGEGRDYDIAVSFEAKSALDLGRLLVDVAEALGVHEDLVDLVHFDTAPSNIILTILEEGKLVYGDPDEAYHALFKRYVELLDLNEALEDAMKREGNRPW